MIPCVVSQAVALFSEFLFSSLDLIRYDLDLFSDEEDSDDYEQVIRRMPKRRKVTQRRKPEFTEYILPRMDDNEFQSHFRLSVDAFEWLLNKIGPKLETKRVTPGRPKISPKIQLLAVCWLLATPDCYRSVASRFGVSKSSIHRMFISILQELNAIAPVVIKWPDAEERRIISQNFQRMGGFEGVVGCVDGTYVRIKAPHENPEVYTNRKNYYGITLQAVCDHNRKFTDCFAGYPSSVSDTRIFRNSDLYKCILRNPDHYFSRHEYILGDKAYETKTFCVPPYKEGSRFRAWNAKFNYLHGKTRQVIERTFALFFGRFRRFKDLDMSRTDLIPPTILAGCVLHNICLTSPSDNLRNTFELEGNLYLQTRQNFSMDNNTAINSSDSDGFKSNNAGRIFREQLALEMGLIRTADS